MKKRKWEWMIDQYFEDNVWSKVPKEDQSPHLFFLIGLISGLIVSFFVTLFI